MGFADVNWSDANARMDVLHDRGALATLQVTCLVVIQPVVHFEAGCL